MGRLSTSVVLFTTGNVSVWNIGGAGAVKPAPASLREVLFRPRTAGAGATHLRTDEHSPSDR
jgi:hypothetical protein